jgi:hypothetical protein
MSTTDKGKRKNNKTKQVNTRVASKTKKQKKKEDPWSKFWTTSITTVVVLWVLFPFYSYQLQVILDQRQCKGQSSSDPTAGGGGKCLLPHNQHQPPYYPCKNGVLPPNALNGKKCPVEHVSGPDWFTYMLHLSRSLPRDIYSIIVGETWITADGELLELERKIKKGDAGTRKQGKEAKEQKGGAKTKLHGNSVKSTQATKMDLMTKRNMIRANRDARKTRMGPDKNSPGRNATGIDIAITEMEKTFGYSHTSFRKNKIRSLCCEKLKKYGLAKEEMEGCTADGPSLFDYPPFNWILPKKYGWPYNYIYDDPAVSGTTAYNPDDDGDASNPSRWFGAWFAKTQQRSWSTSRSIWSDVLSYFLPYLHEELPVSLVGDRLDEFIDALDKKLKTPEKDSDSQSTDKKNTLTPKQRTDLSKIRADFDEIRRNYRKGFQKDDLNKGATGKTRGARELLFQAIEGTWSKNKTTNYFDKGEKAVKTEPTTNNKDLKSLDNIYLDFYIAASKPESLRKKGGPLDNGFKIFWNFLEGDYRYWFRYLTTLYMPILSMIIMILAFGTGLFTTPFASLNRYSAFVFPLFFGLFVTFYNMAAMPAETFFYMLFGAMGKRDNSSKCPYEGGTYQMQRNLKAYWPINLFITLAIIVSTLGTTLTKTGKSWGLYLTLIFPVLIGIRLLTYIGYWLWSIS